MKNAVALLAFIILQTLLGCSGCKNSQSPGADNPYGLPNATQTGANVFACRINGQNFIVTQSLGLGTYMNKDTLRVWGEPDTNGYFHVISFQINKGLKEGQTYAIDSLNTIAFYDTDSTCLGLSSNVPRIFAISGSITLTKLGGTSEVLNGTYNPNTIVSGNFNLIFIIPNCDTLKVTDGRLDINYSIY